jgi:hypothetical protein
LTYGTLIASAVGQNSNAIAAGRTRISDLQPKLPGTVAENRNNEWPTAPQNGWGGWLFNLIAE